MTYTSQAERTEWKRRWRERQGRSYAGKMSDKMRVYQKRFWGWLALKAANLNVGARVRGVQAKITGADVLEIWLQQRNLNPWECPCAICGRIIDTDWTIDHIKPLAQNGPHSVDNLQIICRDCHCKKSAEERMKCDGDDSQPDFLGAMEPVTCLGSGI